MRDQGRNNAIQQTYEACRQGPEEAGRRVMHPEAYIQERMRQGLSEAAARAEVRQMGETSGEDEPDE